MNSLRKKVFWTIFGILSSILIILLLAYNINNYYKVKSDVEMALDRSSHDIEEFAFHNPRIKDNTNIKKPDESFKYIDTVVYTIIFDDNLKIVDVYNHSRNNLTKPEIINIADKILHSNNAQIMYVGNLYFSTYSYKFTNENILTIIDNSRGKEILWNDFWLSIFFLMLMGIVIFAVARILTNWIVKPVKQSFDKQKTFIADASHELKTPLSVIMASSEALEQMPEEKKWIKNIQEESNRMNRLIFNLLKLASTEEDNIDNHKDGDLSKTVELAALTFEGRAYEKEISIKINIDPGIIFKYNEDDIKQLVEIILDNAIKHSRPNSNVQLNLYNKNKFIELIVVNVGEGIPTGDEEKIFERFYRADKARSGKDNRYGLGLAIAKNIVENHNGQIFAKSINEKTIFKVIFKKTSKH